ncbi:MAG: FG-GAP-like repeat-containing protein [Terracidiphilus sp.]|jgi:hypothetical protein
MKTAFQLFHFRPQSRDRHVLASIKRIVILCTAAAPILLAAGALQAWAAGTATATTLAASSASVATGKAVTLTATVKAGSTSVTAGQVNFCNAAAAHCTDINLLGTAQLTTAGTAAIKFIPALGSHSYKAVFVGTTAYVSSSSANSAVTVTGSYPTTTTIAPSGSAGNYTLMATVSSIGNAISPSGTVSFLDTSNANYVLGTASTVNLSTVFSFLNSSTPATGDTPYSIAVADFNGDGIADLAIVNNGDDSVTILIGNGDGTFTAATSPAAGSLPYAVTVADFNGDGIADLAVANSGDGTVSILLGNGNGTFNVGTPLSLGVGSSPVSLVSADFNGDGNADLAVTDLANNTLAIFPGNGSGTFGAPTSISTGKLPWFVAVGDFNGDNIPDLVVLNQGDDTYTVLQGVGDGTFNAKTAVALAAGSNPVSVAAADFNADGKADLAIANFGTNTLSILLGNGDGTFTVHQNPPTGVFPNSVAVGDFNQDGFPDLAVANFGDNTISILFGSSTGSFTTATTLAAGSYPYAIASGIFHANGASAPAVANFGDNTVNVFGSQIAQTATATVNNIAVTGSGNHAVEASYPGDTYYGASISATTPLAAQLVTTALTLTANPTSSAYSNPVTLTATLAPVLGQGHSAGGTVTFWNGLVSLATVPVTSATVSTIVSTLPVGTDSLSAVYSGDTNFAGSTGGATETVSSNFTFTAVAQTIIPNLAPGQSAQFGLQIAPSPSSSTYPGVITFSATAGLPTGATASFSPTSIPVNGPAQTVTMTIQTAALSAANRAPASPLLPVLLGLLLLPLAGARRFARGRANFSRLLNMALLAAALTAVASVAGCGSNSGFFGQSQQSYTVTVTASGGSVTHTATVNLNVQ